MKHTTGTVARVGVLGALALALSFLEGLVPPLPGVPPGFKLGLSNLAGMYAAGALGLGPALFLALIKGAFALLTRGFAAGCMSLAGGLLSAGATWGLWRLRGASLAGIGMGGALAHNLGQLGAAVVLTGPGAAGYAPLLLVYGVGSGLLTGVLLRGILPVLQKLESRGGPQ